MSRVVLITGASRGIGAAAARMFAAGGDAVCVNYQHNADTARTVVASIEASGGKAIAVQADVSQADDVEQLFSAVDEQLGALDVLINNAGISSPRARVEDLKLADLRAILDINVIGVVLCAQAAIRRMSTRHGGKGGAIVNLSSGSAYIGNPGDGVHYALSKGAVNSFTIGASQELVAQGIRVNAVSPGLTRTDMPGDKLGEMGPKLPLGRPAEPEEVAEAIVWLASEGARHVAGANIRVAGGRP
ncbi:MAG: SDR family oxidoreductase [Gammaproteobacteria bacterium]|nr:SDR family oxidoreductase [Gammaproteobacteria bacterium]